ncbi:MAG: Holliday junction ATP-dependent DNA helicase RuvA [Elusimicrobiaceae bacterium]|nr:Holliday junction ATP-dependent DNA helicase RuvA [Elusimicrobiaceae bacterium]
MIAYLKGEIIRARAETVIVSVNGVGYCVNMAQLSAGTLAQGEEAELFIAQSFSQFDGPLLYGFLAESEQELFELFRSEIPKTGAKKALEYLNKALKSLPDFKAAVVKGDARVLRAIFGFSPKTSEKLISALRDKIDALDIGGGARLRADGFGGAPQLEQVLSALTSLGYTAPQARKAISGLERDGVTAADSVEDLIRRSLRILSA